MNDNEIFLVLGTKLVEARGASNLAQKITTAQQVVERLTSLLVNLDCEMQAHKTRFKEQL